MRLQGKARNKCQRDSGRSWAVGREVVGDGSGCVGVWGGAVVVVVSGFSPASKGEMVGIGSYSSVRAGWWMCAS
jgi:hypothetical protein